MQESNRNRQRDYYAANLDKMREKGIRAARVFRERHPEKKRESDRAYRESHPRSENAREYDRRYRESHLEKLREYGCRHKREHPEQVREANHLRRARLLGVGGSHTGADASAQLARQRGLCFWCKTKIQGSWHDDHVVPLAGERASWNGPENIVIACPRCNAKKSNKDPMDFAGILF